MKSSLEPVISDRHGGLWNRREVTKVAINRINNENFLPGNHELSDDFKQVETAGAKVEAMIDTVADGIDALLKAEKTLSENAKAVSGKVRDAAEKLSGGLAKVEKAANFDRLERYVELLERAASAMTVLAELEKTGKLDKIASAIR